MAQYRSTLAALLVALVAPACAPEGAEALDPIAEQGAEIVAPNGTSFNGTSFNGTSFNGTSFNGAWLNGTSFNGTSFNGTSFNGTSLDGSELVAVAPGGAVVRGASLVGADLPAQLSNGSSINLHVDAARTADGLWFYKISYPTTAGAQPLCGTDAGGAIEAIPLAGRWDYRQGVSGGGSWINDSSSYTLACRGAVLAKCVELGYKPWAQSGSTSLRPYHQACTRMMRADYCGDGTAHTVSGTPINLYDNLGIQTDSEAWSIEAEWTDSGARFVTTTAADMRYQLLGEAAPACLASRASSTAGQTSHFSTGTLLMNEY